MLDAARRLFGPRRAPAGRRRRRPPLAVEQLERRDTPSKSSLVPVASVLITQPTAGGPGAGTQEVVFAIDSSHKLFSQVEALVGGTFVSNPNGWRQIATGVQSVAAVEGNLTAAGTPAPGTPVVEIFTISTKGILAEQITPFNNIGTTFTPIGAGVEQVTAVYNPASNQVDVFAVDGSEKLFEQRSAPGVLSTSGGWGAPIATGVHSVCADFNAAAGRIDIFEINTKDQLFEAQEVQAGAPAVSVLTGFAQIGAGVKSFDASFNRATQQEDILAVDSAGKLFLQTENNLGVRTGNWIQQAANIKDFKAVETESDPATGGVDVFALADGGKLYAGQLSTTGGPGSAPQTALTLTQIGNGVSFVNAPSIRSTMAGPAAIPIPPAVFAEDDTGNLFQQTPTFTAGTATTPAVATYRASWIRIGVGIEQPGKGTPEL